MWWNAPRGPVVRQVAGPDAPGLDMVAPTGQGVTLSKFFFVSYNWIGFEGACVALMIRCRSS